MLQFAPPTCANKNYYTMTGIESKPIIKIYVLFCILQMNIYPAFCIVSQILQYSKRFYCNKEITALTSICVMAVISNEMELFYQ